LNAIKLSVVSPSNLLYGINDGRKKFYDTRQPSLQVMNKN
jgi:hypothetical protein